jgi:membrane-bound lytic murein transglycosylase B
VPTICDSRAAYHQRDDVLAFVDEMTLKHGFSADVLHTVFAGVKFQESLVKAKPPP